MPTIRFAVRSSNAPQNLEISYVPATFTRYIWDVNTDDAEGAARAGRMRWAGQPFGVIELGPIDTTGMA